MISSLAERPAPVATAKQKRSAKMSLRIRPSISRIEPRDIKDEGMRSRKWQIRHKGAAVLPRTENERSAAAPASGCARRDILGCRYSDIPRQKVEDVKLSLNSNPPPSRGHHSVLPFVLDARIGPCFTACAPCVFYFYLSPRPDFTLRNEADERTLEGRDKWSLKGEKRYPARCVTSNNNETPRTEKYQPLRKPSAANEMCEGWTGVEVLLVINEMH